MFGGMGGGGGFDFADLFGMGSRGPRTRSYTPAQDMQYDLTIPFDLAITGGETTINMGGRKIKMRVPAGVDEGGTLRLRGQGQNGGDALIKVHIQPNSLFTKDGNNLIVKVPISLKEAILGTTITIPLPSGTVAVKVPPYTDAEKVLRLKGKGVSGKGFDGRGNYTLGIKEFFIFPEIDFNKVEKSKGFNITIVTTATNDKDAKLLLKKFNMPFNS